MRERPGWQWMYNTPMWRLRRAHQLAQHPLCAVCAKQGVVTAAKVVHHIVAHRGNWQAFCDSPLESLCKKCHDEHTASVERSGKPVRPRIGLDGWPV